MYDSKVGYEIAIVNSMISSSKSSKLPVLQHIVIGYLKERSIEAWP